MGRKAWTSGLVSLIERTQRPTSSACLLQTVEPRGGVEDAGFANLSQSSLYQGASADHWHPGAESCGGHFLHTQHSHSDMRIALLSLWGSPGKGFAPLCVAKALRIPDMAVPMSTACILLGIHWLEAPMLLTLTLFHTWSLCTVASCSYIPGNVCAMESNIVEGYLKLGRTLPKLEELYHRFLNWRKWEIFSIK